MSAQRIIDTYKQTEVGFIPMDWDVRHLGTLVTFRNGKAHEEHISNIGKYVVVNSKFISTNGDVRKYSDSCLSGASKGEILMVMSDVPNGRAIARCFYVSGDHIFTVNQRICAIKPHSVNGKYLFYKLDRHLYYLQFDDGVKQTNLRKDDVLSCPIALPRTLAEQEAIAEALGDADSLIESLEQLISKKRNLKQAAMQELLTGKRRLPGFEGEWEDMHFRDLVHLRNSRVDPSKHKSYEFCVELEHIGQRTGALLGHTQTSRFSSLKSQFFKGDILFGKLRAYLRKYWLANRDGVCSTEIWVLAPQHGVSIAGYVFHLIQQDAFIDIASTAYGTHMPRSDWGVVKNYAFSVPCELDEQSAIAKVLSDMDAEIEALEARLAKARLIKQGMMQELLTGSIRLVKPRSQPAKQQEVVNA